jgi:hypothetical protein
VDIRAALPDLLPKAISWAEAEAIRGAAVGRALSWPTPKFGERPPRLIRALERMCRRGW